MRSLCDHIEERVDVLHLTSLHDYQTLDSIVTLNQFQHSKYLYRYGIRAMVPAKRTRGRTVAIDINIIRGTCETTYS